MQYQSKLERTRKVVTLFKCLSKIHMTRSKNIKNYKDNLITSIDINKVILKAKWINNKACMSPRSFSWTNTQILDFYATKRKKSLHSNLVKKPPPLCEAISLELLVHGVPFTLVVSSYTTRCPCLIKIMFYFSN